MSKRDPEVLIEDIRDAMRKVSNYVEGMDLTAFMADEQTVDAVVRNVSVIGRSDEATAGGFQNAAPGYSMVANGGHEKPDCT